MKPYSLVKSDFGPTKPKREMSSIDFLRYNCDIHGRLGDTVYRRKRNGERYRYPYKKRKKYDATTLSNRSDIMLKKINTFTNVHREGFQVIINKMYYYTPYFVFAGNYGFTCNRFFKITKRQDYYLQVDGGIKVKMHLAGRTRLEFSFENAGEHVLKCYRGEELFSERKVVVIADKLDLATVYADWFEAHLLDILKLPEPRKLNLEKYFRCVFSPCWLPRLWGTCENFVLYSTRHSNLKLGIATFNYMYSRKYFNDAGNVQSLNFLSLQSRVNSCWNTITPDFKDLWEKYHIRWFDRNYMKRWKITKTNNLWSKLIFQAASILGFDMETLSVEHFLPGVETIGDLIAVCGMGRYGLSAQELSVKIFF